MRPFKATRQDSPSPDVCRDLRAALGAAGRNPDHATESTHRGRVSVGSGAENAGPLVFGPATLLIVLILRDSQPSFLTQSVSYTKKKPRMTRINTARRSRNQKLVLIDEL